MLESLFSLNPQRHAGSPAKNRAFQRCGDRTKTHGTRYAKPFGNRERISTMEGIARRKCVHRHDLKGWLMKKLRTLHPIGTGCTEGHANQRLRKTLRQLPDKISLRLRLAK